MSTQVSIQRRWRAERAPRPPFRQNVNHPLARRILHHWTFFDGSLHPVARASAPLGYGSTQPARVATSFGALGLDIELATDAPRTASLAHIPQFSVFAWVLPDADGTTFRGIVAQLPGAAAGNFYFYVNSDNKLRVDIPFVLANVAIGTTAITRAQGIRHVGMTRTGSAGAWSYKLWLDGKSDLFSQNTTGTPNTSDHPIWVGGGSTGLEWEGVILEALVIAGDVSEAEAYSLWHPTTRWDLYAPSPTFVVVPAAAPAPTGRVPSGLALLGVGA